MKKLLAITAFGLALTLVDGGASAQQRLTMPGPAAHKPTHTVVNSFPMPAAQYELIVSKALEKMRGVHPVGPVTQGDLNKVILLFRDCASHVEADGYVTIAESNRCTQVVRAYKQERMVEVMANSGPSDWQRWSGQVAANSGSTHH